MATLERIKIKTGGFAVFIAMFAGFVEPDEKEFDNAKKISKLRVIGAGATSNVIFALALGALLLTNIVCNNTSRSYTLRITRRRYGTLHTRRIWRRICGNAGW